MKIKAAWKYTFFLVGVTLAAIMTSSLPLFKTKSDCLASQAQTVVRWKDEYMPCRHWWSPRCIWPIRRKHSTYKITVNEGIPMHNEKGQPIVIADGKIRQWTVYDSTVWNKIADDPAEKKKYAGYQPIADNEYVVVVETRYRLFHHVESNLRICTQKP